VGRDPLGLAHKIRGHKGIMPLEELGFLIICFHGTNEANAKSILKRGFLPDTYFAAHLEDALEFGGNHVFEVAFQVPKAENRMK
jgi:hypothetical protein